MEIKEKQLWYVVLAVVLIASLLINLNVSMKEPLVFGDEGWWASKGKWILNNLEIPKYSKVFSHSEVFRSFFLEQPLLMFLVSSSFALGGELLVKAINPILGFLIGLVTFLFVRRVYSTKAGVMSAIFLSMIPSFITYEVLLYAEVFAILLVTTAIYFFYRGLSGERKYLFLVLGGMLSGFAAITEIVSIIMPLIFLIIFVLYKKNWLKNFVLVLIVFSVVAVPLFGIHNYLISGKPGIPKIDNFFGSSNKKIMKEVPELNIEEPVKPTERGRGTGATVVNMGIINYIQFAYALAPFIFAAIGLGCFVLNKKKGNWMILVWLFVFMFVSFVTISGGRAESAARNMLYVVVPLSILAGISGEKIFDFLKEYGENVGKILAVLFVFVLLCFSLFSTYTKAESLRPIKEFSPAFFNGCDWIRRNTPEDSLLVTLWRHRAEYACERDGIYWGAPGGKSMVLAGNESSYEIMKAHGADYVYLQKFSIQPGKKKVSYPWVFVRYIENSDNFKEVYEYPNNCMDTKTRDCIIVYKVL